MERKQVDILGIPFLAVTQSEFLQLLIQDALEGKKRFVVTANPEIVMQTRQDNTFKQVVLQADYIVADGVGILMAAEQFGDPLPERVTGFDTLTGVLEAASAQRLRVYFLGAKPEISELMKNTLADAYPALEIVGIRHGYFDVNESIEIAEEIRGSGADFVFVALGAPAQEKWILSQLPTFDKGIFMGVGGSFDVLSGSVKRAPRLWIVLRLEWFYRLMTNPSRWRRYFAIPQFMMAVRREKKRRNR